MFLYIIIIVFILYIMFLIIYYYIYNIINYNVQYAPHQREHVERQDLLPIRDGGIGYVEGGVYKTPPEDEIAT